MNNMNNYDRFVNKLIYIAFPLLLLLGAESIDGLVPGLRERAGSFVQFVYKQVLKRNS